MTDPEGIEDDLVARAAEVAAARGETVDDVIARALTAYLTAYPENDKTGEKY